MAPGIAARRPEPVSQAVSGKDQASRNRPQSMTYVMMPLSLGEAVVCKWALRPFFVCVARKCFVVRMQKMDLSSLLEKTVTQLGYELVDLEMSNRGKLLRLFIDKPEGITIDDCTLVSNHISHVLAVEHDIDYDRLEISSPGLDRVLKKAADFERFAGERIKLKLRVPLNGRKNYVGKLQGLENGEVLLQCAESVERIALSNVEKARLDPEF
jgi:ribosome maturation factor RimP